MAAARKAATTPSKAVKAAPRQPTPIEMGDVSSVPSDWEWDTVSDETATKVLFDTIGDIFVGQYKYETTITPSPDARDSKGEPLAPFDVYIFRGRDEELYSVNKSWKIEQGMEYVKEDDWVRMTYVKDVPTGRGLNPMKDIKVEVRTR